jgi:DNA mismatch repair protein PMS2
MRSFRKELRAISRAPQDADSADVAVGGIENDTGDDEKSASQVEDTDTSNKNVVSLSKQDFREFTIIGQYNLGFILAKCRKNHLWVLDQHACDEKYNFERLRANTVMHEQKLIAPMPLELSPSEESCILENMQVFEENGFRFAHDPDKPPRYRLSLTALPHSGAQDGRKAVQFGKEDVHALCAMLSEEDGYSQDGGTGADGSGMYGNNAVRRHAGISQTQDSASKVLARLPKAVAMFANRACRGSIMIGTALSQKEMETVVKRLADVENPWSCPHGRPTMRHVKDLTSIMMEDEQRAASLIAGPTMAVMTQQMTQEQNTETLSQQLDNEDA